MSWIVVIILSLVAVVAAMVGMRLLVQASVARRRGRSAIATVEELSYWTVGGIAQAVQIRGERADNPLLVYLHGGPGWPMMPRAYEFQRPWEAMFTVVQWDQRLGGKTLARNGIDSDALTIASFVDDGLDLVAQLKARFPQAPIVLMGHSWGTVLAVEMVRRAPEQFAAYVAIGQVSDFLASERYGYATVLAEAERRHNASTVEKLSAFPNYGQGPLVAHEVATVRKAYVKHGFANHATRRGLLWDMLQGAFKSPDYGWLDLFSLVNFKAQMKAFAISLAELPHFHDRTAGSNLSCPMIMVGGQYDLFTPTPMAKAYFDTIEAPYKEFIEVAGLAHGGPLENAAFFEDLLRTRILPLMAAAEERPKTSKN